MAIGLAIPGTASEKPESLILFPCVLPQLSSCFVCFGWSCCHKLVQNLVERLSSWSKVCLFVCFWPGQVQVGWEPWSRIISCHLTSKVTYSRDQGVSLAFAKLPDFSSREVTSCVCGRSTTDEPASNFSPNNVSPTAGLPPAGRRGRGNSEIKKSWQIVQRREDIEENRKCVKLWDLRGCPGRSRGRLSLLIGRAAMRNRVKTSSLHFGNFDLLSLL